MKKNSSPNDATPIIVHQLRQRPAASRLSWLVASTALVSISFTLPALGQTVVTSDTTLNGNQNGNGGGGYMVQSGTLTVNNGTLSGFVTTGGAGSGGGAGLGGAIMVESGGTAVLNNVNFANNTAAGGEGGVGTVGGTLNGVAAGAAGDNGAAGLTISTLTDTDATGVAGDPGGNAGTGGPGGTGGTGGNGSNGGSENPLLITQVAADAGSEAYLSAQVVYYTALAISDAADAAAAVASITGAGEAAGFTAAAAEATADATAAGVDLAIATTSLAADTVSLKDWDESLANGQIGQGGQGGNGGLGGNGSYGQGGGEGGAGGNGGNGGSNWSGAYYSGGAAGGNGGQGGNGGNGGFGAGGGEGADGGAGGATGNAGVQPDGQQGPAGNGGNGGFGGGNGANGAGFDEVAGGGQGGSGYGGSIFVQTGGKLEINGAATFNNDDVTAGGSADANGQSGQAAGTDLFIMHGANVSLAAGAGDDIVFNGSIADDSPASIGGTNVATGQGGGLTVDGASNGVVEFNNVNTYTGMTKLVSGVLQAQDGTNIDANSNINFEGGILQSSGSFTRYLGTASDDVQWGNENGDNGGGFAAIDGGLTVTLNQNHGLAWGQNNFVTGNGATLDFGSTTATDDVTFTNAIALNGVTAHIAVTANQGNSDYAIMTGVLSGNGGLVVGADGQAGVLEFTGNNTYSGGTTINGGTLALASGASLDSNGSMDVASGATFDLSGAGNQSIGNLTGSGNVALGGGGLTLDLTANSTFGGVLQDGGLSGGSGGGLTVENATETLTGVNTYTGATTIASGAGLALSGQGAIADSSGVADDGTFDISGAADGASIKTLSGDGMVDLGINTLTLTAASTDFSGDISGLEGITVAGGDQTFSGVNSYENVTDIESGSTLALSGDGAIADSSLVTDNGVFDISAASNGGSSITTLDGDGGVNLGANTLTLTDAGNEFDGVIGGTGGLTVSGGAETLGGVNTYTGDTIIDDGAGLDLTGTGSIALASGVDDNGTFDISAANSPGASIATLSGGGVVHVGANTLTITAATDEFDGDIEDSGNLEVFSGTQTLGAENDYTGTTTVDNGATLALTGAGGIAASSQVDDNGMFDISASNSPGADITTLLGGGTVALGANQLTLTNASTDFAGGIGGTGGLTVAGGDETLSGVNSYTGDTIIDASASLLLSGAGSIADSAAVTDDGIFDISGSNAPGADITTLNGDGNVTLGANTLTLTAAADTFAGTITGAGGFEVAAGGETLTGVNTYTGVTTVDSGATLYLSGAGGVADSSSVDDNGTFDISAAANGGSDIISLAGDGGVTLGANTLTLTDAADDFAGDMSGTGNLHVAAGDETFSGVNDYTGHTTVDNGATFALSGDGSIAVSDGVTDNGLFDISAAGNGGSDITTLNGDGMVALGSNTLSLTDANDSFAGVIGGAGNLHVAAGDETLTGVNTFTGLTTVDSGATLALSGAGAIATAAAVTDNGTFDISAAANGGSDITTLNGGGTVALGSNTLTLTAAADTFAGQINGAGGGLTMQAGSETLTGVNTYTGLTDIESGTTLALSGLGSIADSDEVADDGVFDISAASNGGSDIETLSGDGTVKLGANTLTLTGASDTFSGVIQGSGGVTMQDGLETLTNINTDTGATDIQSGNTLALSGIGSIADSDLVMVDGTFDISAAANGGSSITTMDGDGDVVLGANTLTLTDAADSFAGTISGTGGLHSTGGTETLTGANQYTGATTIDAGTDIILSGDGGIAESSGVADNGTLDISGAANGGSDITTLRGDGAVALGANTLTLTAAADDFQGDMSGAGGLTVSGGTETLSGVNGFTGGVAIADGATLVLSGAGSVAAASGVTANGTFDISEAGNGGAAIATLAGNGNVTLGANTLQLTNASTSFGGEIAGTGNLNVAAGTQTLTAANSYTGVTEIQPGAALILTGDANIAGSSLVVANGTLDVSGETNGTTINALDGDGVVNVGAETLNVLNGNSAFDGAILGTGDLNIEGGNLTIPTLQNNSPYLGGVTVNQSTVTINQQSENDLGGTLDLNNGAVDTPTPVVIDQPIDVTGDSTLNGPSGTGGNLSGSNSTILTGDMTGGGTLNTTGNVIDDGSGGPSGGADVQSGTFEVGDAANPGVVFDGDVTVGGESTLRGHGTIDGNVTSGGDVFPGGTTGILTITGNYTQTPAGTLTIEVTPTDLTAGTGYDRLAVGGTASLAGTLALQIDPQPGQYTVGNVYKNVVAAGHLTGGFSTLASNSVYQDYMSILPSYTPTGVNLTVTASPLAYNSGNAVLDNEYIEASSQLAAMDTIFGARTGSWGAAGGSFGNANGDTISDYNLLAGQGFAVTPDVTLGVAYGHLQTTTQAARQRVQGDANAFYGYGMFQSGGWQFGGIFGGGTSGLTATRHLSPLAMSAGGSKSEGFYDAALQLRYAAPVGRGYVVPFARIGYVSTSRGAFAESGAGNLDIAYSGHDGSLTALTAGVRAGYNGQGENYDFSPWAEISGTGFAGNTNISDTETIGLTPATERSKAAPGGLAGFGAGVTFTKGSWTGTLAYQGQFASGSQVNDFGATVTYKW